MRESLSKFWFWSSYQQLICRETHDYQLEFTNFEETMFILTLRGNRCSTKSRLKLEELAKMKEALLPMLQNIGLDEQTKAWQDEVNEMKSNFESLADWKVRFQSIQTQNKGLFDELEDLGCTYQVLTYKKSCCLFGNNKPELRKTFQEMRIVLDKLDANLALVERDTWTQKREKDARTTKTNKLIEATKQELEKLEMTTIVKSQLPNIKTALSKLDELDVSNQKSWKEFRVEPV